MSVGFVDDSHATKDLYFRRVIPLQISVKEKIVSMEGLGLKSPQRDLTEILLVVSAFQTNLSSASLSKCTLERIAFVWSSRPEFLPRKGLIQENNQNQAWPSHIPILSSFASLSLDNWNRAGNCYAKLPLSVQSSSQNLILLPLPTNIIDWWFTISCSLLSLTQWLTIQDHELPVPEIRSYGIILENLVSHML